MKISTTRRWILLLLVMIAGTSAVWAQSGKLVFVLQGNVWMMNTDGTNQTQLTTVGGVTSPRLANGVVVFRKGDFEASQLYRTDTSSSVPTAIPGSQGALEFDLSPGGDKLVLTYFAHANFDLYTMSIDGSDLMLINAGSSHQQYPSWGLEDTSTSDRTSFRSGRVSFVFSRMGQEAR